VSNFGAIARPYVWKSKSGSTLLELYQFFVTFVKTHSSVYESPYDNEKYEENGDVCFS
jgi:hypothetical protein